MSSFRFVAAGDAIITKRVRQKKDPAFRRMVDLIRGADAAFVNLEVVTPRKPLVPSAEHGGANLGAQEFVLDELKWMGFNLLNVANNHSNDFTYKGIVDTMDAVRERDMVFAGGGMNLGEARSPGYLDTNDARVAVLGATTSFVVGAPAGPSRMDMPGRPGISPLRVQYEYHLDPKSFAALGQVDEALGTAERRRQRAGSVPGSEDVITLPGMRFVKSDTPGIYGRVNTTDLDDICKWIGDAKRQAEYVVMSLHAHQGSGLQSNSPCIADFLIPVAHKFIDSGADVVVGHGPHMLRGMELYRGKPIFYSLGDFYYVSSGILRYPAEIYERHGLPPTATPADVQDKSNIGEDGAPKGFSADERFWQSVIPVLDYDCSHEGWRLLSLVLHPIDLNFRARHRSMRGEPRLSDAEAGRDILAQLQALSEPFGLEITVQEAPHGHVMGRVRLD